MSRLRTVDQPTFDRIECDRCGACCENFSLSPDLDSDTECGFWRHHGPLGWLELYAYYEGKKVINHFAPMDSMLFYGQLEPTLEDDGYRYRCGHFERDADGLGVCTMYDQRPVMCSEFPYGKPTREIPECVWNVYLLDFEPMWRLGIGERDCEPELGTPDAGEDPASPYLIVGVR